MSIRMPALVLLGALSLSVLGVISMSKQVLFSEVRGVVLSGGSPVSGATLEREYLWTWKKETGRDTTTTDSAGRFHFPQVSRSSLLGSLLPHQPLVSQTILIRHAGRVYKAWLFDKRDYEENGELDGRPIVLECSLESPEKHSPEGVYGICDIRS